MASSYVDSLNTAAGQNRFRYQGFADRVAAINVDLTAHKQAVHESAALPDDVSTKDAIFGATIWLQHFYSRKEAHDCSFDGLDLVWRA
jgi:hypothetical protein